MAQKWSILVNVHVSLIRMCILQLLNGVFFSRDFSCSFVWDVSLSPWWLPLSMCSYVLGRSLCLPVLAWWPYIVGIPWAPVTQSPWSPALRSSSVSCVSGMCPPVVVDLWLLLSRQWVGLTLRLTGSEDWPSPQRTVCCGGADPTERDSPRQGLLPAETTLWVCCLWSWPGGALW